MGNMQSNSLPAHHIQENHIQANNIQTNNLQPNYASNMATAVPHQLPVSNIQPRNFNNNNNQVQVYNIVSSADAETVNQSNSVRSVKTGIIQKTHESSCFSGNPL